MISIHHHATDLSDISTPCGVITTHLKIRLTSRVEDGRGGFRLSVAVGVSFDTPPQSDLP